MPLTSGTRLGPYEVIAPLGSGGMGEVYRARDPRLSREVAVKLVATEGEPSPDRLRRFETEARAAAQLSHPNVVTVFDVGIHGGAYAFLSRAVRSSRATTTAPSASGRRAGRSPISCSATRAPCRGWPSPPTSAGSPRRPTSRSPSSPMPDVTQPPLHTLSHDALLAKLDALTNLRVVRDESSPTGWSEEIGSFPGWKDVPTWRGPEAPVRLRRFERDTESPACGDSLWWLGRFGR